MAKSKWILMTCLVGCLVSLTCASDSVGQPRSDGQSQRERLIALQPDSDPEVLARKLAILDDATLRSVQMIGSQTVYAAGDQGVIRKSTDGGKSWGFLNSPVACRWNSLCFLTDRIGWVAGGELTVDGVSSRGCLLKTLDGGETWTVSRPQDCGMIHQVKFFDLQQGVLCGEGTHSSPGGIWRTSDGGKTWVSVVSDQLESWRASAFGSIEGGVVAGLCGKVALVGGNRLLKDRVLNLGMKGVHSLVLDTSAKGWLVGDGGLLRYSPAGAAWQDPPGLLPDDVKTLFDFRAVSQVDQSVWIAGHPGSAIWSSHDGGQNWSITPVPTRVPLNGISFADRLHGCAVGELGTILYTEDGGQTWLSGAGPSRRLAVLQYAPRAVDSSFCLTARYSGHWGYRTGIIAICSQGTNASSVAAEDLKLQNGVSQTAAQVSNISWALPLDLPGLERNQEMLLERWDRAMDGQLSEMVLSHLVRDLRTYRPTIIVLDLPDEQDQASQLLRQAIQNAVKAAADPTWFVGQQQVAGLSPWTVQRVFERSRSGRGGDVILDNSDYLSGLNQSVRMAAGPAYQQLQGSLSQVPLSESFDWIREDQAGQAQQFLDLFTGIIIGPGSDARRAVLPLESARRKEGESLARQQRNFSAYARTRLHDEQQAAQMIAQLGDVVGRAPARQAVQQLLELAEKYQQNGQWDYYEAVLMQAIENYPQEPLTTAAAVQLIPFWASREMTQLRLSNRSTSVIQRQIDQVQMVSEIEKTIQASLESPEMLTEPVRPAVQTSEISRAVTLGSRQERGSWETTWQQRAFSVNGFLEKASPEMSRSPQVQLSLASLYRKRGSARGVQEVYQRYLNEKGGSTEGTLMRQIAETEFWLQSRSGLTPRRYLPCYTVTSQAPFLDGMLSDESWQDAEEIRLKFSADSAHSSSSTAVETPLVMIAYDSEYFYLAGSFPRHEKLPDDLPVKGGRKHDADLSGFDRLQLAFDLDRDLTSSYVLEVDQRGQTRDRCWQEPRWNPQWFVACDADATHWRVELAIPFRELTGGQGINTGEVWGFSLSRILPGLGVQSLGDQKGENPEPASYHFLNFR